MSTLNLSGFSILVLLSGCSSIPPPEYKGYSFPVESAFVGVVKRPYKTLGVVRSKVNYQSLDPGREENDLCKNYYNHAIKKLVSIAKEKGGDAVIDVKSVVFLENGQRELYSSPECSDDGFEGQVLAQGIAIKWIKSN